MDHIAQDRLSEAVRLSGRRHRDLAEHLGLSPVAFSDRMRGRTRWTLTEAHALSLLLGFSLDELLAGDAGMITAGLCLIALAAGVVLGVWYSAATEGDRR